MMRSIDWLKLETALRRVGIEPPANGAEASTYIDRLNEDLRQAGIEPPRIGEHDEIWYPRLIYDLETTAKRMGK